MSGRQTQLSQNSRLNIYHEPECFRANKIICTIGPKTQTVEALKGLIRQGMNVVRMNFSHGSHDFHRTTLINTRAAAREMGVHVAIALDTKGPEIRTGVILGGEWQMELGHVVIVTTREEVRSSGTKDCFYVDYKPLVSVMNLGDRIFIDDGLLALEVKGKNHEAEELVCEVVVPSTISSNKGCNLPGKRTELPAVSEKDREDLAFGVEMDVDFIFASFIRSAAQVREVREVLGERGQYIKVISKIENHEGVMNLDEILLESDGIMVARGDLGVELPPEKVFTAQKYIISKCNIIGKPCICATQMLESMTKNPRPTRAEVSDVANAVLDGADSVMASGETAKGMYPEIVVSVMSKICREAQAVQVRTDLGTQAIKELQTIPLPIEESICSSAVNCASELNAKAILVLTNSGKTAQLMAKYHPRCPILCCSTSERVCRQLSIVRSVFPMFFDLEAHGCDEDKTKRVEALLHFGKKSDFIQEGDIVLVVHADLVTKGYANQVKVVVVTK